MSQLFDKQSECIKREFKEKLPGLTSSRKPTKKCAMKMKESRRKNDTYVKMFLMGGKGL